jgi:hypothetical protein
VSSSRGLVSSPLQRVEAGSSFAPRETVWASFCPFLYASQSTMFLALYFAAFPSVIWSSTALIANFALSSYRTSCCAASLLLCAPTPPTLHEDATLKQRFYNASLISHKATSGHPQCPPHGHLGIAWGPSTCVFERLTHKIL